MTNRRPFTRGTPRGLFGSIALMAEQAPNRARTASALAAAIRISRLRRFTATIETEYKAVHCKGMSWLMIAIHSSNCSPTRIFGSDAGLADRPAPTNK